MTTETTRVSGFTRFVEETEPRLRLALCSTFGREVGLDATADALVYGWEHWDRVQRMVNPQGYLWTVGRNCALRAGSKRSLAFGCVVIDHLPWIEPGLPAALESLSERQRVVVMLTEGYEWTHAEVATVLGVSVATIQRHKERGLYRLRRALGVEK
jgi:DNA-directed RNA polymerase specialized sigma24 family protein